MKRTTKTAAFMIGFPVAVYLFYIALKYGFYIALEASLK